MDVNMDILHHVNFKIKLVQIQCILCYCYLKSLDQKVGFSLEILKSALDKMGLIQTLHLIYNQDNHNNRADLKGMFKDPDCCLLFHYNERKESIP